MKKCFILVAFTILLSGCAAQTFETVDDAPVQTVMQPEYKMELALEDGVTPISGEQGTIYLCDGYEIAVQVLSAGDIAKTLRAVTGFGREELTVFETRYEDMNRLECVWTAVGETGDMTARCVIFDDGLHHYCVSVMAAAEDAAALIPAWNAILESVTFS